MKESIQFVNSFVFLVCLLDRGHITLILLLLLFLSGHKGCHSLGLSAGLSENSSPDRCSGRYCTPGFDNDDNNHECSYDGTCLDSNALGIDQTAILALIFSEEGGAVLVARLESAAESAVETYLRLGALNGIGLFVVG